MSKSKQEHRDFFHRWIVPALHAVLWLVAILCSNELGKCSSFTQEKQALLQFVPILIVFLFELSVSIFDVFCAHTSSFINISFLRFVALFIFLLGVTVVPLFLFALYESVLFYCLALGLALPLKYLEIWLLNNFDKYDAQKEQGKLGKALGVASLTEVGSNDVE